MNQSEQNVAFGHRMSEKTEIGKMRDLLLCGAITADPKG